MSIWNISDLKLPDSDELKVEKEVRLWKSAAEQYRVIEQGSYLPILCGSVYTLIKKKYAITFEDLTDQVRLTSAIIHDYLHDTVNNDYVALDVYKKITPQSIESEDSSGSKLWTFTGSLFVSDDLKHALEKIANGELNFYLGFQWWA